MHQRNEVAIKIGILQYNPNELEYNPNAPEYNPNKPEYNPNEPEHNPNEPATMNLNPTRVLNHVFVLIVFSTIK